MSANYGVLQKSTKMNGDRCGINWSWLIRDSKYARKNWGRPRTARDRRVEIRKTSPEHDTEYKIGQQNFENQHQISYRIWGFQGGVVDSNVSIKIKRYMQKHRNCCFNKGLKYFLPCSQDHVWRPCKNSNIGNHDFNVCDSLYRSEIVSNLVFMVPCIMYIVVNETSVMQFSRCFIAP